MTASVRIIRVLIADDHVMVREGLAQLLGETDDIEVVGQAGDGFEAIQLAEKMKPDVIVLDYTMPKLDGFSAIEQLRKLLPAMKILILTVHENVHYAIKAFEAQAHGFMIKASAASELVEAIRCVFSGKMYVSSTISEKIAEQLRRQNRQQSGLSSLSQREFELLRLLGKGSSLQQCAQAMYISESAASTYRSRLLKKLNLKNTGELVKFAVENNVVG
ncbi:MAG: response regulator transcription factor [Ignavibacteriae bacterium]|nr:response regulator transcription factor [Ignavibacteria bacterium]MBI3365942.1 response regulator transcription factor [Ignavibacteriota bacterium]